MYKRQVERHRNPSGRKTAPRLPHMEVLLAKERAPTPNATSGGRRKEPSRGRLARSPGKERIPGEGGVSNIFGGVSLPGMFFRSPVRSFNCMEGVFCGDGTLSSPPVILFSCPRVFWINGRASDSVPTNQWFEPRLQSSFVFEQWPKSGTPGSPMAKTGYPIPR